MEANAVRYEVSELKTSNLSILKLVRKWFEIEKLVRVGPDDLVGIGALGSGFTAFHQATGNCHSRSMPQIWQPANGVLR